MLFRTVLLSFTLYHCVWCLELYTVSTGVGSITGKIEPVFDQQVATKFLGIPFAEAPVGNLRFRKPVKRANFGSRGFNATRPGVACSQMDYGNYENETLAVRSEDCLLLNIYVPHNMSSNPGQRKPVMVWIYGGGFIVGESNTYDGSLLSVSGDVIVVTINYRLGILGFLTSGDSSLPGNLGLWDQQLALQWVHGHIESFGGDSNSVTIFGESAGSASVMYQCFYPGNIGLFHRAIAQSGSITSPWAAMDQQLASFNLYFLADRFNCDKSSTTTILNCLRAVPVNNITDILQTPAPLTPVNDGDFVLDTPTRIITGQSTASDVYTMFNSVDLMIGYTNADGLVDIGNAMALLNMTAGNDFLLSKTGWEDILIPFYLGYFLGEDYSQVARMMTINEYTDWRDPTSVPYRGQQFVDFLTDSLFLVPSVETADLHSTQQLSSTYMYEFAVRPIKHAIAVPPNLDGDDVMNHADDIIFVFGDDIDKALTDPAYAYLLNTYQATMTLWTNFAKTGNPNTPRPVSNLINTTWPQYATEKNYIKLTTTMSPESVKTNPRPRTVNYWTKVIPGLIAAEIPNNTSRQNITVRVTTQVGEIIGVESYVPYSEDCGFRVQSFQGIPYAKPPTGNLRFQKPVPKEPFTQPFDGSKPGPSCYQVVLPDLSTVPAAMSEDCLVLNVFVPKFGSVPVTNKAVMIWIHGGGFSMGESNAYDPRVLSGYNDVIVVTINYRLGQLGFLTTGDTVIPSNIGLWDQHLAIKWVHDNIQAFGGDSSRITIFGESAGSASVILQTFYPGNRGLFHRAIAQSGSNASPWAISDIQRSIKNTRDFSAATNCPLTTTRIFLECLQSKSIQDLQTAMTMMTSPTTLPVRDNDFILDDADKLMSGQTLARAALDMFHSVDLMIGFNSADGLVLASQFPLYLSQPDFKSLTIPRSGYEDILVPIMFNMTGTNDLTLQAKNLVLHEYTDWSDPESEAKRAKQLVDLYTDYWFAVPSVQTTDLHAADGTPTSTYLYQFSVRPFVPALPVPDVFDGPGVMNHADEIYYVMGNFITNLTDSDEYHQQLRVYLATMTMWANFAKSGDPNTPIDITKYLYTSWPEYTSSRLFLEITEEITQHPSRLNPRLQGLNFWTKVFPETQKASSRIQGPCDTSLATITHPFSSSIQILIVCFVLILSNHC